ncbi:MAG: hypothetical protein ACU0BN_17600 [Sulfitobacter sp.]
MKAILHIGMHKTGTSSIQASFAQKSPKGSQYFNHGGGNLNGWARLMFSADASIRELKALRNATPEQIQAHRHEIQAQSDETLGTAHSDTIIFSAEYFAYLAPDAVQALMEWLSKRFDQIEVFAYIRDPLAFVRSSYQQRLKAMAAAHHFIPDMPKYQYRFEKFENVFGKEKVHYRLFRRDLLTDQNVVTDFAEWVGLNYDITDVLTENKSLSAEALAFLVAARLAYQPKTDPPLPSTNHSLLVARLLHHKGQKWSLTPSCQKQIMQDIAVDCDWMDARLDTCLQRNDSLDGFSISNPKDFIPLALESFPVMRAFILEDLPLAKSLKALVNDLEKLRTREQWTTA